MVVLRGYFLDVEEVQIELDLPWRQREGALHGQLRLLEPAEFLQCTAQIVVRIGKARRGGKRLLIKLDRLLVPVQLLKRDAEAVIGFRELWIDAKGLFEVRNRLSMPVQRLERAGEAVVGLGVFGVGSDGAFEVDDRFFKVLQPLKGGGKAEIGFGMIGVDRECLPICRGSFVETALRQQRIGETSLRLGRVGVPVHRLTEQFYCVFDAARLQPNHSQMHEGIDMSVITRQDRPIYPLGLAELTLFMKRERFPEFPRQQFTLTEDRPTLSHRSASVPNFQEVSIRRVILAAANEPNLRNNRSVVGKLYTLERNLRGKSLHRRRKTLHTQPADAADGSQRQIGGTSPRKSP